MAKDGTCIPCRNASDSIYSNEFARCNERLLTREYGNAARRRGGQNHGGLVLAVLLGDERFVVVKHWYEPRRDELARLPAHTINARL